MVKITATESVTLDGVMQGLGRADEDTRGGFRHGGWGDGYQDQVGGDFMAEGMAREGAMLFGRRSYEDLLGHWTSVTEANPFTDHLTAARKYVTTRTAGTTLAYPNSTLLVGEAVETVAALKRSDDVDLTIIGSGELVRSLHAAGLVDEYVLLIHPIVLGSGVRLFGEGQRTDLQLVRQVVTTTGLIIAQYTVNSQLGRRTN